MFMKVLKAFRYAHDHHHTAALRPGEIVDIDEGVLEGLLGEKLIGEATQEEIDAAQSGETVVRLPVEIPEGWEKLHWMKYRSIAVELNGGQPVANKNAAVAIIEAELARRAAQ